jgi:hypothetical protein
LVNRPPPALLLSKEGYWEIFQGIYGFLPQRAKSGTEIKKEINPKHEPRNSEFQNKKDDEVTAQSAYYKLNGIGLIGFIGGRLRIEKLWIVKGG